jgi:threonine/homoserine/homoserine lactone efflux protein
MSEISVFLLSAVVFTLAPGPDVLQILARGLSQGRGAALAAAMGFVSGNVVHTSLAAFGLALALRSTPWLFDVVRGAGAAYLLYLGVITLRRDMLAPADFAAMGSADLLRVFRQSVIANVLNPKVTLFFLSFLPQFVVEGNGSYAAQVLSLGGLFMLQALFVFGAIALAAARIGAWLRRRPAVARNLNRAAGLTFIGLAVRLAWPG